MSIVKQILLSLVVIAVAAGGWFLYDRWDTLFGQTAAVAAAGGAPGGAPAAAGAGGPTSQVAAAPGAAAGGASPSGRPGGVAGPGGGPPAGFENMTPEQRQAAFAARRAAGGVGAPGEAAAAGAVAPGGPPPSAATPAASGAVAAAGPGGGRPAGAGGAPGGGPPGAGGGPRAGGRGPAATLVVTGFVEIDRTASQLRAVGTLAAARAVTLFPPAGGVLAEVAVVSGAELASGALVARLDDAEQLIAVERAELALDEARKAADRAETLARSSNITDVALATARAAVSRVEIDLRSAQLALDRRRVTAPFGGTAGLVTVFAGDTVSPTTALTTLDDLGSMTATFLAPQAYATRLTVGHPVTATAEGVPGAAIMGGVTAVAGRVDEVTRTFEVVATLTDGLAGLKPGMSVVLSLDFAGEPRPSVPSQAVQWDRNGSYVWRLDGDQVRRTPVSVVSRGSGMAVLAGALAEGDEVVVEGLQRLREGGRVTRSQSFAATLGDGPAGAGAAAGTPAAGGGAPPGAAARSGPGL